MTTKFCALCEGRPCRCGRSALLDLYSDGISADKVRIFSRPHATTGQFCHAVVDFEDGQIFEYYGETLLYPIGPFMPGQGVLAFEAFVTAIQDQAESTFPAPF